MADTARNDHQSRTQMPAPRPVIAMLGATGAVGRHVVVTATAAGLGRLRLGVRKPSGAWQPDTGRQEFEVVQVDVPVQASLDGLVAGADVLVNCLGPTYRLRGRVASAAHRAGIGYVDPSGDDATHLQVERLACGHAAKAPMLTGVGAVPGAFGLMARGLVASLPGRARSLHGYVLTAEPIHAGTALEFLLGLYDRSRISAAWSRGERRPFPGHLLTDLHLPTVDGPVTGYPYLTGEMEKLARDLRLEEAAFYHVFESGGEAPPTPQAIGALLRPGSGLRQAATSFAAMVNQAMLGRAPVHLLAAEARCAAGVRSAILRCPSSYRLTACLTVLAVREILGQRVPPGVFRADVLAPALIGQLAPLDPEASYRVTDGPLSTLRGAS